MKRKNFLGINKVLELWLEYNRTFSYTDAAEKVGIVSSTARRWVMDIQSTLAGEKVRRERGQVVLKRVVKLIQEGNPILQTPPVASSPVQISASNTAEDRVDALFEELKQALSDLAIKLAEEKTKEITEAARRSNVVGMIAKQWSSRV